MTGFQNGRVLNSAAFLISSKISIEIYRKLCRGSHDDGLLYEMKLSKCKADFATLCVKGKGTGCCSAAFKVAVVQSCCNHDF